MAEKFGHIKNPLSIIAIFAGIAEISGTLVLPHISPEHQGVFIWFLMLFPTALVFLFFITLWCKHQSLYAPSDWRDESNFFRGKARQSTAEEITIKQEQSIADGSEGAASTEANPEIPGMQETKEPATDSGVAEKHSATSAPFSARNIVQKQRVFARAEDLLAKKMEKELGGKITRNMTFIKTEENRLVVDGVLKEGDQMTLMEFIVFPENLPSRSKVFTASRRFLERFADLFSEASNIVQTPIIAIAGRGPWQPSLHEFEHQSHKARPQFKYFDLNDLEREFGTNVQDGSVRSE